MSISRKVAEEEWTLDKVLEELERELKARERALPDTATRRPPKVTTTPTVGSFVAGDTGAVSCCYCHQGHQSHLCRIVTQYGERRQCLRRAGRCFTCLRKGHLSKDCRSKLRCSSCGGRHHLSLCDRLAEHPRESVNPPQLQPDSTNLQNA